MGTTIQIHSTRLNLIIGLKKKTIFIVLYDTIKFFINNFTASAMGWSKPIKDGLLGPIRLWEYPKILRSNKVINATLTKTKISKINRSNTKNT